jgi:hypothetical protein
MRHSGVECGNGVRVHVRRIHAVGLAANHRAWLQHLSGLVGPGLKSGSLLQHEMRVDVAYGSDPENLKLRKSSLLRPRSRRDSGHGGRSEKGQTLHFALQEKQRPFAASDHHEVGHRPAKR